MLTAGLGAAVAPAAAQPPADPHAEAQAWFDRGVAASQAGRWDEAHDAFARAYELSGNVTVLVNLAAAQVQTGHLVDAAKSYRRFLEQAPDDNPHRGDALRALTAVQGRIATVRVRVLGGLEDDEVRSDGVPLPIDGFGGTVELDPGRHVLSVRRGGRDVSETQVVLDEGRQSVVTLQVHAPPPTPRDAAVTAPSAPPPEPEPEPRHPVLRSPLFWIVAVALLAGAGIGTWLAVRD